MTAVALRQSVAFRLIASMVLGGLVISIGLALLELRRNETALQYEVSHQTALLTRNLQTMLQTQMGHKSAAQLTNAVQMVISGSPVRAARVRDLGRVVISVGSWERLDQQGPTIVWPLGSSTLANGDEIDLTALTLVQAPFWYDNHTATLELLVDGPIATTSARTNILKSIAAHWVFLALTILLGLMLLRRWVTTPLTEINTLVRTAASADRFRRLANNQRGEFAQLSTTLADMLVRLEDTTAQLRQREKAFESLYQFAPAALLEIDRHGRIVEANRRAAALFGLDSEQQLLGSLAVELVREEDRPALHQTIDRVDMDYNPVAELRLLRQGESFTARIECVGIRDDDAVLRSVRLALQDITDTRRMHRELEDKSRLLNLVIDHMSDAIVLVDRQGKVAAANQQLGVLLQTRPEAVIGQPYHAGEFWEPLGPTEPSLLLQTLKRIEADPGRAAQERIDTRQGSFLFQGIPVSDRHGETVGRLWVVQEITGQVQAQQLLEQQTRQLQAIRQLGAKLFESTTTNEVLHQVCAALHEIMGVEAVGIALRSGDLDTRCRQMLHRGQPALLYEPNHNLVESVQQHLMPQILARHDVTFWPDPPAGSAWGRAFRGAGLTCLAGIPLRGRSDAQGILWVARRGGEYLTAHHIYLLEALGPLVAARLEITELGQRLDHLELVDPITLLPNEHHVQLEMDRLAKRPGFEWSLVTLKLDHFSRVTQAVSFEQANALLRQVGIRLRESTRRSCFVGRLAGPAFAVLCPSLGRRHTQAVAERLLALLHKIPTGLPSAAEDHLTASIGIATHADDATAPEELLAIALERMDYAKRCGRDRVIADSDHPTHAAG